MTLVAAVPLRRAGAEWVVAERDGARALVVRDGQHEYVFREEGRRTRARR